MSRRISGLRAEQVALTNGVDEAIHVLFETFLDAGDELLLPVPTYTMYEVYASATDARVVTVQAADDLQFPFERLLAAITPRTKVIAIANPNSPSGSVADARATSGTGAARAAGRAAGGRGVFPLPRRDGDGPGGHGCRIWLSRERSRRPMVSRACGSDCSPDRWS